MYRWFCWFSHYVMVDINSITPRITITGNIWSYNDIKLFLVKLIIAEKNETYLIIFFGKCQGLKMLSIN